MSAANQDSEELESLFDSIVAETRAKETAPAGPAAPDQGGAGTSAGGDSETQEVISRIGHLTRSLHDNLRELGFDQLIAKAADAIPDTQDRLQYVADMTEKAASRTLAATEAAQPLQEQLELQASQLAADWDRLFGNQLSVEEFKALAGRTRDFLRDVPSRTRATNEQLLEIMMAQDFQDLTGQVIKKMMDMTRLVEKQLLDLLIEHVPAERREQAKASGLAGPIVNGKAATDSVTDQRGVDELLESLGF